MLLWLGWWVAINKRFDEFKKNLKNKKISVIGIGVSNIPIIHLMRDAGAQVIARDKRTIVHDIPGVKFILGDDYLSNLNENYIIKTPGMRFDVPELLVAQEKGNIITSEMELFFRFCPASIIAVTGSDGKTTTTTIIYEMLKRQGYKCWLGGNIGTPLFDKLDEIMPQDKVILELSSFQLHTMRQSPQTAVITNITPNHLDMHKSMDEYIEAKENIYKYQNNSNKLVLNFDNLITSSFAKNAPGNVTAFSSNEFLSHGICLKDRQIHLNGLPILTIDEIRLPGMHNVENYMAAIAAVHELCDIENIQHIAQEFAGVSHRIEFVREIDGVKYFNDSIASSPTRTRAGLYSFAEKVILIAGGYDKLIPFDDLGNDIVERVKHLVLVGSTAEKIKSAVQSANGFKSSELKIQVCKTLDEAVYAARENAKSGDVVIMSPACASFDMFENFEKRGNVFKQIVKEIL